MTKKANHRGRGGHRVLFSTCPLHPLLFSELISEDNKKSRFSGAGAVGYSVATI